MVMKAPVVTLFNNKGGVGKTSTLYNLSRMFAKLGKRVLAVDLDPQANLTSLCLEDEKLIQLWTNDDPGNVVDQTIYHAVQPVMDASGDVKLIIPQKLDEDLNYLLIPGDLRLSAFEDNLAIQWNAVLGAKMNGLNVTSVFARLIQATEQQYEADVVFIDVGPNLGAINRAALIASNYVIIPLVPDLFSLQGLQNVGKYLKDWRKDWQNGLRDVTDKKRFPIGDMQPIGYIVLQHRERQSRLVTAHQQWADRIPKTYSESVLGEKYQSPIKDANKIGQVRNYQSLMAFSHEARKPIFDLRPADGAIGSHLRVVHEAEDTYRELAEVIAGKIGISFDET